MVNDFRLAIYLIGLSLGSLSLGLVYLYFYWVRRAELHYYWFGHGVKRKEKRTIRRKLGKVILQSAHHLGPRARNILSFRNNEKDESQLRLAGFPYAISLEDFYGLKIFFTLVSFVWILLMMILAIKSLVILGILMLFAGFMGPDIWISSKGRERQRLIGEEMPDFLDTISVMLRAGSSLDGALRQVTTYMKGPLVEEFRKFNQEIELGVPRLRAYHNLMERNSSKELQTLAQSLIQGNELGVPVARTFHIQAEDLRASRGTMAKEKAAKASPKITLVTTFMIAPAVFILIIGMLILNMIYNPDAFGVTNFFK